MPPDTPHPDPLLLDVRGLRTWFHTPDGRLLRAVDGVDLQLRRGEVLALVGESGSGKSVTALSVMGLVAPPGRVVGGQVWFQGEDLVQASAARLQALRGAALAMVFQQPRASLNPVQRIGAQIAEQFIRHRGLGAAEAHEQAVQWLDRVELPQARQRARDYPHQLSGGQAQRVMIAIAMALQPAVLIADEPTTALDVTVQAQLLALMTGLCREWGTALLLVTHDLGVVAQTADRVAVMYAGQVVEQADVQPLFDQPQHPYTQGLLGALPVLGRRQAWLRDIPGTVAVPDRELAGCRFAERCHQRGGPDGALPCVQRAPQLLPARPGETACVRCWLQQPQPLALQGASL